MGISLKLVPIVLYRTFYCSTIYSVSEREWFGYYSCKIENVMIKVLG